MNKKNSIVLAVLLALCGTGVSAQEFENEFQPHWYIQGQFGAQYTLGELPFSDLISPNAQLGFGRNFTPVVGLRLSANAWQSKGGSDFYDDTDYAWKWNYVNPSLDVTLNLSNWIGGYKPERKVSFGLLAGLGANIAWGNDEAEDASDQLLARYTTTVSTNDQYLRYLWENDKVLLTARTALTAEYRISDRVRAGVELQANCVGDRYNSKKAGNPDWYFNALAGIRINLGKGTNNQKVIPAAVPVPVKSNDDCCCDTVIIREVPAEAPAQVVAEPLRVDVFFPISNSEVSASEAYKVRQIADYLTKYPNAKVEVTGYADKGTGNATINQRLSEQRAAVVAKTLKEEYGIAENRISTSAKGDTEQPYTETPELNRVSICIAQ